MQYLHALHCRITITQRCLPVCLWSEWECPIQVGLWQYCAHGSCTRMPSPQLIRKWHHSQAKILAWYFNQPAWLASRNNKRLKAKSKSCPTTFGPCSQHTPQLKYSTLTKKILLKSKKNIRNNICDWQSNYHIKQNIFLYCWKFYLKKNVPHFKKLFQKNNQSVVLFWRFWCQKLSGAVRFWFGYMVFKNITMWHLNC